MTRQPCAARSGVTSPNAHTSYGKPCRRTTGVPSAGPASWYAMSSTPAVTVFSTVELRVTARSSCGAVHDTSAAGSRTRTGLWTTAGRRGGRARAPGRMEGDALNRGVDPMSRLLVTIVAVALVSVSFGEGIAADDSKVKGATRQ